MKPELATQVRIAGLVRSPDREGALAHLDSDRGFAFVARGSMGFAEVVDPTIWVKEKLALALVSRTEPSETPLRRLIGALRAVHAELVARPQEERRWVAALAVLLSEGDGVALIAGDCPCYRFRAGLLSRLGRPSVEASPGAPPQSALGSETRVRIEVVPLHPEVGDCYILCTDPLREGEMSHLARELLEAREDSTVLRRAISGAPEKGWVAFRVLAEGERGPSFGSVAPEPAAALDLGPSGAGGSGHGHEAVPTPLEIEPLAPALPEAAELVAQEPATAKEPERAFEEESGGEVPRTGVGDGLPGAFADASDAISDAIPPRRARALATLDEERPWYEPVALWAGGALAIVALALLVRSILPGLTGSPRSKAPPRAVGGAPAGWIDIYSDPPGAVVKIDGVATGSRTPAVGVTVKPGVHRIDLDWGAYGSWRDTVEIASGARLALRPRVLGSAAFRSSDPARSMDIYVDGAYVGSTPLTLDSLAVGRHLVRFGGPGIRAEAQDVEVFPGVGVELVGSAGPPPENGKVTVRSATLGDTGFEPSRGDPVWVDNEVKGVTPLTAQLKPGAHSIRVARRAYPPQVTVLEVKSGGDQFVTAEFGARSEEPLRFDPPASISLTSPLPLTLALPESEWDSTMVLWIHAAVPQGSFQARRMTPLDGRSRTFAALVPREVLRNGARTVRVYFKATGAAGRELYSEIYTIPVSR